MESERKPGQEEQPRPGAPETPASPANGRGPASASESGENGKPSGSWSSSSDEYQRLVKLALQQRGDYGAEAMPPSQEAMTPGMTVTQIQAEYQRNVRRMEWQSRFLSAGRYLIIVPVILLALYTGLGWRNLNRANYDARVELKRVGTLLTDRTDRIRTYVPIGASVPNEASLTDKIIQAQALIQDQDFNKQLRGVRDWTAALQALSKIARSQARSLSPTAAQELSQSLERSQVREQEYLDRYNQAAKDYNQLVNKLPQSLARPVSGFPQRIPLYVPERR